MLEVKSTFGKLRSRYYKLVAKAIGQLLIWLIGAPCIDDKEQPDLFEVCSGAWRGRRADDRSHSSNAFKYLNEQRSRHGRDEHSKRTGTAEFFGQPR